MTLYTVTWTIEVEADNHVAAAFAARRHQRPGTTATVFEVATELGEPVTVDLWEHEAPEGDA